MLESSQTIPSSTCPRQMARLFLLICLQLLIKLEHFNVKNVDQCQEERSSDVLFLFLSFVLVLVWVDSGRFDFIRFDSIFFFFDFGLIRFLFFSSGSVLSTASLRSVFQLFRR